MQVYGITQAKTTPALRTDGTQGEVRLGSYGEMMVTPVGGGVYPVAMEGNYYVAVNPTFGTANAYNIAAATTFSELQGSIFLRNANASGGRDIYLDYIRIVMASAPTAATNLNVAMQIDNGNRYSSGSVGANINNRNIGSSTASGADLRFGPLVLTTAVAARKLGGPYILKTAIPAVNDEYLFNFGAIDTVVTAPGSAYAKSMAPVYLPAGSNYCFLLHLYSASQSASGTAFFEVGWFER